MKIDKNRLQKHLADITRNSHEIRNILNNGNLESGSIELKAAKYLLKSYGRNKSTRHLYTKATDSAHWPSVT